MSVVELTQDHHFLSIETPLGKDHMLLTSLAGEEALSQLFSYKVELLSEDHEINPESLIGRAVKLVIGELDGTSQPIHGLIGRFYSGSLTLRNYRCYTAEIVPWTWLLTHTSDCRIFQKVRVPEIIERVFQTFGFTDYEIPVTKTDYPILEFCVQYRETAFSFICRLMEQAGMFYFFRQDEDRHVMVVGDKNVTFRDLPHPTLIHVSSNETDGHVTSWQHSYAFRPGRWAQMDYDFEVPTKDLLTSEKTVLKLAGADAFERFDYPGLYIDKNIGARSTRTLIEAEEAAYHLVNGTSRYLHLCTGGKFKLRGHPCQNPSEAYVVSRVRHEARDPTYLGNTSGEASYSNSFEALPFDVRFRPQRTTTKPVVHGPQTATVVGPPGEKIFTDKHGRVRVQFHWDRYGKHDDKSSCWIRVSNSWAGRGWGAVNLPHVGHEVVVSFLEGDPDRPLVTGRVYNGENMTAMGMPDNKTQSAIRDHSGNEIVMEGKAGSQDIRVHAVKDMHVTVDNNREMHVKAHLKETVDQGQEVTVAKGYKETITESATSTISGGLNSTVNDGWTSTIHGKFTETATDGEERTVSSGKKLTVTGGSTEDTTGERKVTVTGAIKQSSTTTTDLHASGAGTYTSDASLTFSVGQSTIQITSSAITITAGPSSISLDASGVAVAGTKISLNG